eukprot:Filipodium_phascolosomae@DN455_c0_g1_i1.p1
MSIIQKVVTSVAVKIVSAAKSRRVGPCAAIYCAGGGASALSALVKTPDCSAVLIEGSVLYDREGIRHVLGREGEFSDDVSFVSDEVARALADKALMRAIYLKSRSDGIDCLTNCIIGVGATCSLVSSVPKKGLHRIFVTAVTPTESCSYRIILEKGARSREDEELIASLYILELVAQIPFLNLDRYEPHPSHHHLALSTMQSVGLTESGLVSVKQRLNDAIITTDFELDRQEIIQVDDEFYTGWTDNYCFEEEVKRLCEGKINTIVVSRSGCIVPEAAQLLEGLAILSGSFNPLHDGHKGMAAAAMQSIVDDTSLRPPMLLFEISVQNADKGVVSHTSIVERARQITQSGYSCLLTRAPLFSDKIKVLQGVNYFIVGADTFTRLIDPIYYGGDYNEMLLNLGMFWTKGIKFYVCGRIGANGEFSLLKGLSSLPKSLQAIFVLVEGFRMDISSTELRSRPSVQK